MILANVSTKLVYGKNYSNEEVINSIHLKWYVFCYQNCSDLATVRKNCSSD